MEEVIRKQNNWAYIDGSNLHNGVKNLGWDFDYARFRVWLSEKYLVGRAYIFLGMIPRHRDLYDYLEDCGYILVFKEVVYDRYGKVKGNCDADLIVHVMEDFHENRYAEMVLVSSDGDYVPLVKFLMHKNAFHTIISPFKAEKCSILLKRLNAKISYITDQKTILEKEKAPDRDETP